MTITKVLEENRDNLHNTEFCNYFLDMTLKHRPKGWQKISANHLSDRELIIRIYVYIYIYIYATTQQQITKQASYKMGKVPNIQMVNKQM